MLLIPAGQGINLIDLFGIWIENFQLEIIKKQNIDKKLFVMYNFKLSMTH